MHFPGNQNLDEHLLRAPGYRLSHLGTFGA